MVGRTIEKYGRNENKRNEADLWLRSQWNILWRAMDEFSKENSQRGVKITKCGLGVERMCVIAE